MKIRFFTIKERKEEKNGFHLHRTQKMLSDFPESFATLTIFPITLETSSERREYHIVNFTQFQYIPRNLLRKRPVTSEPRLIER